MLPPVAIGRRVVGPRRWEVSRLLLLVLQLGTTSAAIATLTALADEVDFLLMGRSGTLLSLGTVPVLILLAPAARLACSRLIGGVLLR